MASFEADFSQFSSFFQRLHHAARGDFKRDLSLFLEGLGLEFLRILQDEIIRLKVMDSRLLLASFAPGDSDNVWVLNEGDLTLEVGTNTEYATYVNDGHWTNKKGQERRFVPGYWEGHRFIYEPGAKIKAWGETVVKPKKEAK